MAQYYIDISDSTNCTIITIKRLCKENGFEFIPNNKKYYHVNTTTKRCIGVDNMNKYSLRTINCKSSYLKLKEIFIK